MAGLSVLVEAYRVVLRDPTLRAAVRALLDICKRTIGAASGCLVLRSSDGQLDAVVCSGPGTARCGGGRAAGAAT